MGLKLAREGERFTVHFWVDERGHCEVGAFLYELSHGGQREKEDAALLTRRLSELANLGAPRLGDHGHALEDGISELKARNGARVFWFWVPGGIAVCSHGTHKPKSKRAYRPHIERARLIREQLQEELADKELTEGQTLQGEAPKNVLPFVRRSASVAKAVTEAAKKRNRKK